MAYTLVTLAAIYLPVVNETFLRSAFGLGMVLFVPGYALIAALFSGKKDITVIERVALSFGLSIAVTPLIGLALNFTPWGIQLDSIAICLAAFTFLGVIAAIYRRRELRPEERFPVDFLNAYRAVKVGLFPVGEGRADRTLTFLLLLAILTSLAAFVYVIAVPNEGEKLTEFYLLGPDGKAEGYPEQFRLGDAKPIVVGLANHEYRNVTYDLIVALNDSNAITQLYSRTVDAGEQPDMAADRLAEARSHRR